jgi:hypothetical protein
MTSFAKATGLAGILEQVIMRIRRIGDRIEVARVPDTGTQG